MKDRIKKLRKTLGLTQQEFANRIGISRGNIATYETRDGSPGSSVINLICREFNVSETWLRSGDGEMFLPTPGGALDELARKYGLSRRGVAIIERFLELKPDIQEAIADYIEEVATAFSANDFLTKPTFSLTQMNTTGQQQMRQKKAIKDWTDEDIDAETAEYRQELLDEKEQQARSQVFQESGSSNARLA